MKRKHFRIRRYKCNKYIIIRDDRVIIYMVNPKSMTMIKTWWINTCNLKHRVRANKYIKLMW